MNDLIKSLSTEFKDLYRFRYVCYSYIRTKLKQRYRRSVLGYIWTVLAPMINYFVLGFVLSHLGRMADVNNYFVFMFTGSVIFSVISSVVNLSPTIMINNEAFIKKIYLPKLIFVVNTVGLEFANFCFSSLALLLLGLLLGMVQMSWAIWFLPVAVIIGLIFATGLACIISIVSVFFRDMLHIIPAGMQALYFLTPIIYQIEFIPVKYQNIIKLNPFYYFVEIFRIPLLNHTLPPVSYVGLTVGFAALSLLTGLLLLKRYENIIIFRL